MRKGEGDMVKRAALPLGTEQKKSRRQAADELRARIFDAVEAYWYTHGRPPTIREIGAAVNITATSHVAHHVDALVLQGRLRQEPGVRGIFLARPFGLPVKGTIAAGVPLERFDEGEQELLEFGELMGMPSGFPVGAPFLLKDVYALRVRGQSMIEDGILNGDYVLIASTPTVPNGTIAVALHRAATGDRDAATLKRIFVQDDGVLLQPANAAFAPLHISREEWDDKWEVQGKVVAVYRRYSV
jgi:repressor LexA